jgi:hypothetical protein
MRGIRTIATLVFVGAVLGPAASSARAQYFGQNKVQYQDFDFEVLRTEHFDIYHYPEEDVAIEYLVLMAERWYARLSRLLNHDLSSRQPLIMYASGPHFRQTNTLQGDIGESTGGVTEILKRRMVLPFSGPLAETDHVLGHELVHAFQFDITGEGGGIALAGVPTVMRFPLWFVEGMAEYLSVGPRDPNTAMWMRDAVQTQLPDAQKLADPRFFPYRYGHSLWAFVAGTYGDDAVGRILKAARTSSSPAMAFTRVIGVPPDSGRVASRASGDIQSAIRADQPPDRLWATAHDPGHQRRADQPGAGPLARWEVPGIPLGARSFLDRHVPGRRRNRRGRPQDHQD